MVLLQGCKNRLQNTNAKKALNNKLPISKQLANTWAGIVHCTGQIVHLPTLPCARTESAASAT